MLRWMVVALAPFTDIKLLALQLLGLLHWYAMLTLLAPVKAALHAAVVVFDCTARRKYVPDAVPALCTGIVATAPPAEAEKIRPAVWKVVEQVLATEQAVPFGQHLRGLLAGVCSPDSVTVSTVPSAAVGRLTVPWAMPDALKVTVPGPALLDKVAVCPLTVVELLVQGLDVSEHAVTETVVGRQFRLLVGTESS